MTANIVDIKLPVKGQYGEQVEFHLELQNGYLFNAWVKHYDTPSDRSTLGILCITTMNIVQKPINSVKDALDELKKLGKVYAKCTGFREYNGRRYPKLKKLYSVRMDIEGRRT